MKNTITAVALALGLAFTAAAPAKALDVGTCKKLSTEVWAVATLRERGHGPEDVYDRMIQTDVPEEIAVAILKLVYVDAEFDSAQEIKNRLFAFCIARET